MTLDEVLKEVRIAVEKIKVQYGDKLKIKVITDREKLYQADLYAKNCLANLTVGEPSFAPYRYVSFEVAAMINGEPNLIYHWYDDETHTVQDIVGNLNNGIDFMVNY